MRKLQALKEQKEKEEAVKRKQRMEEEAKRARRAAALAKKKSTPTKASTPEIPPDKITLEKKIGEGCYGSVFIGTCFHKQVAIKVPHVQNINPSKLADLRREIEIMSANPHPNICLFMGACTVPGRFKIVTELLDGDVEQLLQSKTYLSVYERMKLAKDAALGLNWLHNSNPAIIHRDLKTANLLLERVGGSYRVKVCDFGLSAIKPKSKKWLKDDKNGAKGTPLFMPPEVMMGEEFNEKADVYSFGIVLWEILTRKEPFLHHSDYDEFVDAICEENERPPIPKLCLPSLRVLMEAAWHPDPAKRPDFEEINNQLDVILIHSAIRDEHGRQFWQKNFLKKEAVQWEEFYKQFYKYCGLEVPDFEEVDSAAMNYVSPYIDGTTATTMGSLAALGDSGPTEEESDISEEAIQLLGLEALLTKKDKSTGKLWVNVETFGNILNWFGPMVRPENQRSMLEEIASVLSKDWFHGDVESGEAQRRLAGHDTGAFLVRFSTNHSHPGCYTISRVSGRRKVSHIRIGHSPSEGFNVNNTHHYPTLEKLIDSLEKPLGLSKACPGSQYQKLFLGADLAGYQSFIK